MPPFRLLPFEHRGLPVAPHEVAVLPWRGENREIAWKIRDEKLFFRPVSRRENSPTFAAFEPIRAGDSPREGLRAALQTGRYGRLALVSLGAEGMSGKMLLTALVRDENGILNGQAREWCGGQWLDFRGQSRNSYSFAPSGARIPRWDEGGWRPLDVKLALAPLATALANRPFLPLENIQPPDSTTANWKSGSMREWESVTRHLSIVLPRTRWAGYRFSYSREAHDEFTAHWNLTSTSPVFGGGAIIPHTLEDAGWKGVLNRRFLVLGHQWSAIGSGKRRRDWRVYPFTFSASHRVPLHPSAHERLESLLWLENWRQGGE